MYEKDTIFVDFRATSDFKKSHILNSVNLSLDNLTQIFRLNQNHFFSYLSALGISPDKKIILTGYNNNKEEIISALSFAYLLVYGGVSQVYVLKGGFNGWQQKGLPVTTLGTEIQPKSWKYNISQGFYYKRDAKKSAKNRKNEILITLSEDTNFKKSFKNVIAMPSIDFIINDIEHSDMQKLEEQFKRLHILKENVLIIYPDYRKESLFLAFILRSLGYKNIFILKGES